MSQFYVYIHLDPRVKSSFIYGKLKFNYEPFYVGKGHGRRAYDFKYRNRFYTFVTSKLTVLNLKPIVKVFSCSSEQNAFEVEKMLIKLIGRRDQKLGPLTNLTDGGEGQSGISKETLKKLKITLSKQTPKQRQNIRNKIKQTKANWTPTEKECYRLKLVNARAHWTVERWDRMFAKRRQTIANWTDKQRLTASINISRGKTDVTSEQRERTYKKRIATLSKKTPEQKEKELQHYRYVMANRSECEKLKSLNKLRSTLNSRTKTEKLLVFEHMSLAQLNRTPKQRANALEKFHKTLAEKTPEQKQETTTRLRETIYSRSGVQFFVAINPNKELFILSDFDRATFSKKHNISSSALYRTKNIRKGKAGKIKGWLFINLGLVSPNKKINQQKLNVAKRVVSVFKRM